MPSLWADNLDEHRALVLGRLLDAYESLRAEVGVDGVTLAAVAQRAGLARSAVYNYVEDKHDLILAHAERTMAGAVERLRQALDAVDAPEAQLRTYVAMSLRMHASETGAGDDLMPMLTPAEQGRLFAMLDPIRELLAEIVADGVDQGVFTAGPADQLTGVVWAVLSGYRMPVAAGHVDPDAAAGAVTTVLLNGLTGPSPR
ncbi:TetR/AcrR family transcriptional regulator [Euzebya sp.]|uniref:TetR/AcrR family transcriptional regulator n=1 Tax=Euzebya sp. TaxID=1971409 RepID=UPI003517F5E9